MIRNCLLIGVLALSFSQGHASAVGHQNLLHLSSSDFHRYPARMLFTPDGKLVVAYRTAKSKDESSTLQVVVFDGRTGNQLTEHSYDIPSARRAKIPDDFVLSRDGHFLYYIELTGNPIILGISASTLHVVSRSTAHLFEASDVLPRVEFATKRGIYFSSSSRLPGKAVHIVALDAQDLSRSILDEYISKRPGLEQWHALSFQGDSIWMGGEKYWLKIGIRSGQVESKIQAQHFIGHLVVFSSGLIGMTNLSSTGFLQLFDKQGSQLKTLVGPSCGFVSVSLSPNDKDGVAVCEKTGTTEWSFGKTLERKAVVFDVKTMTPIQSIPLWKLSLKTSIGTNDERLWSPQPVIYDSGQSIWTAVPDFSGVIKLGTIPVSQHIQQ